MISINWCLLLCFGLDWRKVLEQVLKVCDKYEEDRDHSISDEIKNELMKRE